MHGYAAAWRWSDDKRSTASITCKSSVQVKCKRNVVILSNKVFMKEFYMRESWGTGGSSGFDMCFITRSFFTQNFLSRVAWRRCFVLLQDISFWKYTPWVRHKSTSVGWTTNNGVFLDPKSFVENIHGQVYSMFTIKSCDRDLRGYIGQNWKRLQNERNDAFRMLLESKTRLLLYWTLTGTQSADFQLTLFEMVMPPKQRSVTNCVILTTKRYLLLQCSKF